MKRFWLCIALIAGMTATSTGVLPVTGTSRLANAADDKAKPAADDGAHKDAGKKDAAAAHPPAAAKPAGESKEHAKAEAHGDTKHGDAGHGAEGGHAAEGPISFKTDLALWTLVTFVLFLIVLSKLAWNPLITGLNARESGILRNIQDAESARHAAEKSMSEYAAKLEKAEAEVDQMLADARRNADVTRQQLLAQTEQDVKALKDRALAEIDQVRGQALEQLFSHMANLVTNATEHVLERSLTDADHQRLVTEAVSKFSTKA